MVAQIAAEEGHGHRQGIGQSRGLDHQVVDGLWAIEDPIDGLEQFPIDRAADATVAQLHHVLAGGDHQVVVDADFAKFIHQNGRFDPVLIAEDVVQQGGFTGPQKAGEDGHR